MPRSLGLGFDKKKALESTSDNREAIYSTYIEQRREEKRGEEIIQLATVGRHFYGQPHRVDPVPPPPCCSG